MSDIDKGRVRCSCGWAYTLPADRADDEAFKEGVFDTHVTSHHIRLEQRA
ncbi:hypothetical protein GCM10027515_26670 [Schumannella luteola]|uniref:Uncharacterized protein n=1 Tax=Schumannella luteola TaxID=472059 RepID=A0A852Y996_9MICO|nr:hypothetical protein [Schumannella luteola]NYG99536.1 hypothetical protein [Schumannella luteola]